MFNFEGNKIFLAIYMYHSSIVYYIKIYSFFTTLTSISPNNNMINYFRDQNRIEHKEL